LFERRVLTGGRSPTGTVDGKDRIGRAAIRTAPMAFVKYFGRLWAHHDVKYTWPAFTHDLVQTSLAGRAARADRSSWLFSSALRSGSAGNALVLPPPILSSGRFSHITKVGSPPGGSPPR